MAELAFPILDCLPVRAGWGKGRQRGPDNAIYQDYLTEEFLVSLRALMPGAPVQAVAVRPQQEVSRDQTPDLITWIIKELHRYGHPAGFVNTFYSLGLIGNTFGFWRNPRIEQHHHSRIKNVLMDGTVLRAELVVLPAGQPILNLMGDAWSANLPTSTSLSINYRGTAVFCMREGRRACKYKNASRLISTEFVMHPGAGGVVLGLKTFAFRRTPRRKANSEQMELYDG